MVNRKKLFFVLMKYIASLILTIFAIFISIDGFKAATAPTCSADPTPDCYPFGGEGPSGEFFFFDSKETYIASIIAANLLVVSAIYVLILRRPRPTTFSRLLWFGLTISLIAPDDLNAGPALSRLSIVDLILEAPIDLLVIRGDSPHLTLKKTELKSALKLIDIKNGFAEFEHVGVISSFIFAQYRLKRDKNLLCITEQGASTQSIKVLMREANGRWSNVSDTVLPKISDSFILERYTEKFPNDQKKLIKLLNTYAGSVLEYRLPRYGKKISVISGIDIDKFYGKELFTLELKDERFQISSN